MKRWFRELWWKHIAWREFDGLCGTAIQHHVQRKTIRSWVARGIVRSFVEDGVTFVHREDCRCQYAKVEKKSKAQRERYERQRRERPNRTPYGQGMLTRMLDEQNLSNTVLSMVVKAGMSVEEPEPEGDTDDTGESEKAHQP